MLSKKSIKYFAALFGFAALITGYLFIGIYQGREWGDLHLFLKHRPTTTFLFVSPLGEADPPPHGLSPKLARQEAEYVEFVETHTTKSKGHPIAP